MRNLFVAVVTTSVLALAAITGCSSSDSGNGGNVGGNGGNVGGNGGNVGGWCAAQDPVEQDPEDKACNECMQTHCSAQMAECYGAGYASGSFGGPCGPVIQCQCSCTEGDLGCMMACANESGAACETCVAKIAACEESKCAEACGTSDTPDDDPSAPSAGGCENLKTNCCPKIADADSREGCEDLAAYGDDGLCDEAYATWKNYICK